MHCIKYGYSSIPRNGFWVIWFQIEDKQNILSNHCIPWDVVLEPCKFEGLSGCRNVFSSANDCSDMRLQLRPSICLLKSNVQQRKM